MENPKTILVVDDASLVRLFYRTALEEAGFRVEEALNGLEALEKLLTTPVDLLILDEASRVPDDLYRSVRPMLAGSAPSIEDALAKVDGPAAVDIAAPRLARAASRRSKSRAASRYTSRPPGRSC